MTNRGQDDLAPLRAPSTLDQRLALATSEQLTASLARQLARDAPRELLVALAANPQLPYDVFLTLHVRAARTASLRRALPANPACPRPVLRRLARDSRWDVRSLAAAHRSLPPGDATRLSRAPEWSVRAAIARRPDFDGAVARHLAGDIGPVRLALAGNPRAPTGVVAALLGDDDPGVRAIAASNPAAPARRLAALARALDTPAWILHRVATNPTCPSALRDEALTWLSVGGAAGEARFDPIACTGEPGERFASARWYRDAAARSERPEHSALWRVREASTSLEPAAPPRLETLASDEVTEVRLAVARHQATPRSALRELLEDADARVRVLAAAALNRRRATPVRARLRLGWRRADS